MNLAWMGFTYSKLSIDISYHLVVFDLAMPGKIKKDFPCLILLTIVRAIWLIQNDILFNDGIKGSLIHFSIFILYFYLLLIFNGILLNFMFLDIFAETGYWNSFFSLFFFLSIYHVFSFIIYFGF